MRNARTILLALLILALAFVCTGCGGKELEVNNTVSMAPYNQMALYSLYAGRNYMTQGRYELAREQLLMGISVARSGEMRQVFADELKAVDMMIQTAR